MQIFWKSFFAALLALVIFSFLLFIVLMGIIGGLTASQRVETGYKAVLWIDLGQMLHEQNQSNPLATIGADDQTDQPGIYDIVRMIRYAKQDSSVKGIYIRANDNPNGFGTCEEIRNALSDFSNSGKFIYAGGDIISQKAYYVASVADKVYCNPKGGVNWVGFAARLPYLKSALQKLEIDPQIIFAGKFKSATEPLREEHMTDANRLQTTELLATLYEHFVRKIAESRKLDTSILRKCATEHLIRSANDAFQYKLVDGLKYDDQVKDEIREKLRIGKNEKINFITVNKYAEAVNYKSSGRDRIALIYAEGDIISGNGDDQQIGDDSYRKLIRNARMDKEIKAIVIRINSGGGSSIASENLWREISVARNEKPVVLSFGDVAASGAYYLSCNADSVFAEPTTITGSIGVFTIIPNMQSFFKDKLGVQFDGVKTAPDADMMTYTKPLTSLQRQFIQNEIDSIYFDFKSRVAEGRKKSMDYVENIAQGRVWVGTTGLQLGLVDRIGDLQDAIDCAAKLARTNNYHLKEYPEPKTLFQQIFGNYRRGIHVKAIEEELGKEGLKTYYTLRNLKEITQGTQTRIPEIPDIE
jgi:protease-4